MSYLVYIDVRDNKCQEFATIFVVSCSTRDKAKTASEIVMKWLTKVQDEECLESQGSRLPIPSLDLPVSKSKKERILYWENHSVYFEEVPDWDEEI